MRVIYAPDISSDSEPEEPRSGLETREDVREFLREHSKRGWRRPRARRPISYWIHWANVWTAMYKKRQDNRRRVEDEIISARDRLLYMQRDLMKQQRELLEHQKQVEQQQLEMQVQQRVLHQMQKLMQQQAR